ncbi:MAG: hypothetical protein LQ340_007859, partial [Diploschistes diacapsis]
LPFRPGLGLGLPAALLRPPPRAHAPLAHLLRQTPQRHLALDELARAGLGVLQHAVQVPQRMPPVRRVLVHLGLGYQDLEPDPPGPAARRVANALRELAALVRHALQQRLQGRRDVPERAELHLHATRDVLVHDGLELAPAFGGALFLGGAAGEGVLGEEGRCFGVFLRTAREGQQDDGLVPLVAGGKEVEEFLVQHLARFEEPF